MQSIKAKDHGCGAAGLSLAIAAQVAAAQGGRNVLQV